MAHARSLACGRTAMPRPRPPGRGATMRPCRSPTAARQPADPWPRTPASAGSAARRPTAIEPPSRPAPDDGRDGLEPGPGPRDRLRGVVAIAIAARHHRRRAACCSCRPGWSSWPRPAAGPWPSPSRSVPATPSRGRRRTWLAAGLALAARRPRAGGPVAVRAERRAACCPSSSTSARRSGRSSRSRRVAAAVAGVLERPMTRGDLTFRRPTEADHAPIVRQVDDWWGGRRMHDLLPRLWFQHFTGTSWLAEDASGHPGRVPRRLRSARTIPAWRTSTWSA